MEVGFRLAVASTNKPLLDKKVVDHEKFTARAPTGPHHGHDEISTPAEYKLCVFSSEHSKGVPSDYRKVYISFAVSKGVDSFEDDEGALKGLARESHVGEMERRIHEMQRLVSDVVEEIDLIRDREGDMFVITDDLNRQIWIMGVMSCMAILVTGFLQMYQTRVDLTKHSSNLRGAKSLSREGSKRMTKQGSFHMPKLTRDGSIGRVLNLAKDRNVLPRSLSGHRSAKGTQRDVLLTGQSSEST